MRPLALLLVCVLPGALALDLTLLSSIAAKIRVIVNQSNQPKNDALLHVSLSARGDPSAAHAAICAAATPPPALPRRPAGRLPSRLPSARASSRLPPPQAAYARLAFHDCTGPGGAGRMHL
jgi:hypothetical protein